MKYNTKIKIWGFMFSVPALILFVVFAAYPILRTFVLSFQKYNLVSEPKFIGLENYRLIFDNPTFLQTLNTTFLYTFLTYIPVLILALSVAMLLNTKIFARNGFRTIFFLPVIISWVIVSIIWKLLFHKLGLVNDILSGVGIQEIDWLLEGNKALYAIVIPSVWKELGYFMVMYLAGIQNIPLVYYEASTIDGASKWQAFKYITLPLLRPVIVLTMVMAIITGMRVFDPIFVMTQGGPAGATQVISLLIYQTAFTYSKMGRASAMAVILFFLIMGVTVIQNRLYKTET